MDVSANKSKMKKSPHEEASVLRPVLAWCCARRGAMAGMFGKKEKKEEDLDPELGPTIKMDVPSTFQGWCTLISRVLAPAEELSPFKLGQIQKLIADMCVSQPTPAAA